MKRLTKPLILLLALALVVCAFAIGVFAADDGVATVADGSPFTVNGTGYATWAEAYAAVAEDGTISVTADYAFQSTDFTGGVKFYQNLTSSANDYTEVSGIVIAKPITIDLGGYTLSSSGNAGVLFYINTKNMAVTFTGTGKISSDIPALVASGGNITVNGTAEAAITFEYTGSAIQRHVFVGNECETVGAHATYGHCNGYAPVVNMTGYVNFNTTGAPTVDKSDSGNNNLCLYSAISVCSNSTLNITNATINNNKADSASDRTLIIVNMVGSWSDGYGAKVNISDSTVNNNLDSNLIAAGKQSITWARRADVTITDSTLYSANQSGNDSVSGNSKYQSLAMFKMSTGGWRSSVLFDVKGSTLTTTGSVFSYGWCGATSTGLAGVGLLDDCYVTAAGLSLGQVTVITTNTHLELERYAGNGFGAFGCAWISKDDANYETAYAALGGQSTVPSTLAYVDTYGGYGVLLGKGTSSNRDLTTNAAATPGIHAVTNAFVADPACAVTMGKSGINGTTDSLYHVLEPAYSFTVGGNTTIKGHIDGAYDLGDVIYQADAGTTVNVLSDILFTGDNTDTALFTISKNITVDLGGHTLTVAMNAKNPVSIATGYTVTFQNGTIISYSTTSSSTTHPLFRQDSGSSTLNLTNVNTYTGGLIYSYDGQEIVANITGGEHHLMYSSDTSFNALAHTRAGVTFTATDADFYVGSRALVSITSNKTKTASYSAKASYSFTDCNIIADNATTNLVPNANENLTLSFVGCKIVGSINPTKNGWDSAYAVMKEGSVSLGLGTYLASGATVANGLATIPDGLATLEIEENIGFTMSYASGTQLGGDFAIATSTKSFDFVSKVIDENNAAANANFMVTVDGDIKYVDGNFGDALTTAGAGTNSTITLLKDTAYTMGKVTVGCNLTIDLATFTLDITHSAANQVGFYISSNKTLKFMNGTLKVKLDDAETTHFSTVFASANSTTVFEDVTSYTAGLVYSYSGNGAKVQFIRGEHHIARLSANWEGGFVASRANITVTAEGTKFYSFSSVPMFNSGSRYATSGSEKSTFTFDGCTIYKAQPTSQIFTSNEYTTIRFDACNIHGSLEPTVSGNNLDGTGAAKAGSIVLGNGTVVSNQSVLSSTMVALDTGLVALYDTGAKSFTFSIYNSGTINTNSTVSFTAAYAVGAASAAEYIVTVGGQDVYVPAGKTFFDIIALVDNGGTIRLLKDVSVELSAAHSIKKGMTVDLGGFTLSLVEIAAKDTYLSLESQNLVTFRNGYLTVTNTYSDTGTTYPPLVTNWGNAKLTLEGLKVTSGPLIFNVSADDPKITLTDCEFNLTEKFANVIGGFVESRDNITLTATRCKFYLNTTDLLSSLHYNAATGDTFQSTFTFNDCDIWRIGTGYVAIKTLNSYTTVTLNGCNLYGTIAPARHDYDNKDRANGALGNAANVNAGVPTAANIILGEGTTIAKGASVTATVEDGFGKLYTTDSFTFATEANTTNPYALGFIVGNTAGSTFKLTANGFEVFSGAGMDLPTAIKASDAGSELHLLTDLQIIIAADAADINKSLTINLGGHTIYNSQSLKDNSTFNVSTTSPITIKNGTLVWNINSHYLANYGMDDTKDWSKTSFALFNVTVNGATLNFDDINAYGSALAYSYQSKGTTVNITGGEYHLCNATDLLGGGLAEFRANATLNVTGATVFVDGQGLFTLVNYKAAGSSTATFTDCDLIGSSASKSLIPYANQYTKIYINNSNVYGAINPTLNYNDKNAGIAAATNGSIVLGNGTYLMAGATMLEGVVVAEDGRAIIEANREYSISSSMQDGSIFDYEAPTFNLSSATATYTFTLVVGEPPLSNFVITWYKEDGSTVITTVKLVEGTVGISAPTYTPGASNGWYKVGFDGWTNVFGSTEKVDLSTYVVTGNAAFYPAQKNDTTPTPYLTGAQYNLSFTNSVILNFYLPAAPAGVTDVVVKDANGNILNGMGVTVPSGTYYRLYEIAEVKATELNTKFVITVDFTANGTQLRQTITLSPLGYAKTILADSAKANPTWTSATHTMIADMIRYSNQLAVYTDGATVAEYDTLLETYESLCSAFPANNSFGEMSTTAHKLKGYVSSVSFEVSEYEPRWIIRLNEAKKITDVQISLEGYYPLPDENGINFGTVTYGIDTEASTYSGDYLTVAYTENMPVYNIDQEIVITITTEDGITLSGSYGLNTYFNYMSATGDALASSQEFLRAFRAFALSSTGYRYAGGKVDASGAKVDMFECDHNAAMSASFSLSAGRLCPTCQTHVFFYSDYIAQGTWGGEEFATRDAALANRQEGTWDSYGAIDACHNYANAYFHGDLTRRVIVKATEGAFYYLYEGDMNGAISEITISTNTDWEGAYIISDDEYFDVTDKSHTTRVFCIRGYTVKSASGTSYSASGTAITNVLTSAGSYSDGDIIVAKGATKLNFAPGMPMMINLTDKSIKRYIREGANADGGANQSEMILIDEFGNISKTTPVEWDYTYSASNFSATAFTVTELPIKVSGLDDSGNITTTFENICNNAITATSYNASGRGIAVRRSNVTVEGLDHVFTEDATSTTPRQAYNGLVNVFNANNTTVQHMKVYQHLGHYVKESDNVTDWTNSGGGKNSLGSYEFSGADAINTSWLDCQVKNFFESDGTVIYKGLFGTNRMRNMYLKDCFLNSFDAHSGAYNVTIEDSTFEHINFIGAGDINIDNVTIYTASTHNMGIHLRQDYGATWNGDLYAKDFTIRYADGSSPNQIDLIVSYYTNWYFGYDTYLPHNVTFENVKTEAYNRTSTNATFQNGTLVENVTATNAVPIAIYYNLNKQMTEDIDYSTVSDDNKDPKHCTTNFYITGFSGRIVYPDHPFFGGMNVYLNGTKQNWFSARDFSTGDGCVTGDTLVMLADGTEARIDELTGDELLLVFDHFSGSLTAAPIVFIENDGVKEYDVVTLTFADGTSTELIDVHGYFDTTLMEYVYIDTDNYDRFVGHSFARVGADGEMESIELTAATMETRTSGCYSLVTAFHYTFIVDGYLSMPGGIDGIFNIFEYGDDLKYDEEKMGEDIAEYGLYTYADFADYVPEEVYEAFNAQYFKVAVGKGMITFDEILGYIEKYLVKNEVI